MTDTERTTISFFCPGKPQPQGSKSLGRQGQLYEQGSHKLKMWREAVAFAGLLARNKFRQGPFEGPVELYIDFRFARPVSHILKNGQLRKGMPISHTSKPDLDKLVRGIGDALTGVLYDDDRQVIGITASKAWVEEISLQGVQVLCVSVTGEYEELVRTSSLVP